MNDPEPNVIDRFWAENVEDIKSITPEMLRAGAKVKGNNLPLARVKKIMRLERTVLHAMDKSVEKLMIKEESVVLMAKACELFVKELTRRSWRRTEMNNRIIMQKIDVQAGVQETDVNDFLLDIVPRLQDHLSVKRKYTGAVKPIHMMEGNSSMADRSVMKITDAELKQKELSNIYKYLIYMQEQQRPLSKFATDKNDILSVPETKIESV